MNKQWETTAPSAPSPAYVGNGVIPVYHDQIDRIADSLESITQNLERLNKTMDSIMRSVARIP